MILRQAIVKSLQNPFYLNNEKKVMPLNSKTKSYRSNAVNLLCVFAMLGIVFGCVCPSGKEKNTKDDKPISNKDKTSNKKNEPIEDDKPVEEKVKVKDTEKIADNGDFKVEYMPLDNQKYANLDKQFKDEKILEDAATKLNRALALPHDVKLRTKACNEINAFFNPQDKSITVCYELMEHFFKLFQQGGLSQQEANRKMTDATTFVFFHELGHGLVDAYDLDITGNEEDAVDRLSTYVCVEELGNNGSDAALAGAQAFALESKYSDGSDLPFYDEHPLQQQRYYNIVCLLYGYNQNKYSDVVEKGLLPEARAVRCPGEYERNTKAWKNLLSPYRKK